MNGPDGSIPDSFRVICNVLEPLYWLRPSNVFPVCTRFREPLVTCVKSNPSSPLPPDSDNEVTLTVGPETLARSTLGELRGGQRVNLERPLRLSDRLGGHLVAGHVDDVGRIACVRPRGEALDLDRKSTRLNSSH